MPYWQAHRYICAYNDSLYISIHIFTDDGQLLIILFYLHLAFMIRAFLILYPIIPDTEATVAPTAFLHMKNKPLKLCEAKKKQQHTVTEKISDLTKEIDSLRQQVGQSK